VARKTISARDLTDTEILRIARGRVQESAASTFTQIALDTQLSVERGVIWMINFIEFDFQTLNLLSEVAAAGQEDITAQVTRESKTSLITNADTDMIQKQQFEIGRSAAIGTDAGPLWFASDTIRRFDFPVPIPYAAANIFFGILGTDAGSPHTVDFRIGYTIREVTDKFFFRVAQALIA
jgi:hypothetical protein